MIQVDGLTISYRANPLFEKASFTLQPGERCGLVGRNGSGKTTLFRLLIGKETTAIGNISTRKNYRIGTLDQHIQFTQSTVIDEAALGLRPEDKDSLYKAEKILFGLGFSKDDLQKSPHDLSGGYHLRLHLAKVLISEPDCLLLDEPTNYLDIVSIRWFERFLKQWKGEFILISHDREFMDSVTTHTMGIHRQKFKKIKGSTIAYYEQLLLEEEVHEKTRSNLEKKRAHAQSFVDRFGAKATKAAQAASRKKMIQRIPVLERLKEIENLEFHFNEAPFVAKKMMTVHEVSFNYPQSPQLIDSLFLEIEKGERVAIVGKNGRGKSTILRLINQELTPSLGTIKISENARIGYFGQTNIDRLHPQHTIEEEIALANPKLNQREVKALCGLMMFSGDLASKPISVLSGGEKSRVLLGKILAAPCNLLLLDEPTHHLDLESIEALIDAMEDFEGAIILVTHSELLLKRLDLNKMIVCREGSQELFLGNYEDFLSKDGWHEEKPQEKPKKIPIKQAPQKTPNNAKKLEKEVANYEQRIEKLEQEQKKELDELLGLFQGNGQRIQELSKSMSIRQKELDSLYSLLDQLL